MQTFAPGASFLLDISSGTSKSETLSECPNVPECLRMSYNVPESPELSHNVPYCPNLRLGAKEWFCVDSSSSKLMDPERWPVRNWKHLNRNSTKLWGKETLTSEAVGSCFDQVVLQERFLSSFGNLSKFQEPNVGGLWPAPEGNGGMHPHVEKILVETHQQKSHWYLEREEAEC